MPEPSEGEPTKHQDRSHNNKERPKPNAKPESRPSSNPQTNKAAAQEIPSEQGQEQSSSFPSSQLSSNSSRSFPPQGTPLDQGQGQSSSDLPSESSSNSSSSVRPQEVPSEQDQQQSTIDSSSESASDSSPRPTFRKLKRRIKAWKRDPEFVDRFQTDPNHFPTTQDLSFNSSRNTVPFSQQVQTQGPKNTNPRDFDLSSYSTFVPVRTVRKRRLDQEHYDPPLSGSTTDSEDFSLLIKKLLITLRRTET